LRGGQGCYGVGAAFAGGLDLVCDGDFAHAFFEAWEGGLGLGR
jgi:hypothetical protein